jgi:acylphosphatase
MTAAIEKATLKCHSIVVTGKVQDIGFRSVVEHIGRSFGIPGLVFNAKDGSVKILCSGEAAVIDDFTQTIRIRGEENGTEIASIKEKTLAINIDLPDEFSKVSSDDEFDLGRKFDKANLLLKSGFEGLNTRFENLNKDLNTGFNDIKIGINNMTTIMLEQNKRMMEHSQDQKEHNIRMDEHNKRLEAMQQDHHIGQQEHNKRLEAILEKLANKV